MLQGRTFVIGICYISPGGARCCLGLLLFSLQRLLECGSVSGTAAYFCTCSSPALVQLPVLIQKAIRDSANIWAGTDCRRAPQKGRVCVSLSISHCLSPTLYIKAIAYIFCAKCLPLQSVCSWVHSSKTNFEIWGSNCSVSQGNSLQNKSGLKRQKSSPNLPVPGQISTEFHGSSLSFCLDNRCRTDYEESICATQKESTVLQNHCSLPCFLYSVWPITYKCLHCKLSDCWLTTCWVCCSLRTSGLPTLSPTSYTHITALHIFIWHLKQALHYLENSFVQKWWHASTFDIFQHFCLVYMLPKWEIFFGMTCLDFLKFGCLWQDENHFKLSSNCKTSCRLQFGQEQFLLSNEKYGFHL